MDTMSDLIKVESVSESSNDIDLLLPAPQQADGALSVKEMCEIPSALVESSSEDQVLDGKQEACLTDGVVDQTISNNMDISQDNTEEVSDPANVQEISGFTGVDIIALQNSANTQQPLFQLVSSGDGSYVQLSDSQLIQTVTVDQGLHTVTLPTGVTALIQQPDKQDAPLEGQAIQLDDGSTAIVRNIQPNKENAMAVKLLEGQVIQLEDGTTGFIQRGLAGVDMQSVQLEDGSTAYISLFGDGGGGVMNMDNNGTHELPPLRVIAGTEENDHQVSAVSDEDSMNAMSNVKQEVSLAESAMSVMTTDTQAVVTSEEEQMTTSTNSQPHVSGRALALGDKAYRCPHEGCGRLYTTQHHLRVHGRSHTGDKPFRCEFPNCGKAFPTGYGLKSHTRVHTGEKPYRCSEENCTKAFKTSGDLQKHIRTHTGERPFKCPFEGCNRMFTTSNIRKVHIRTHTGERPYVCEEEGCNKSFASATNYKNHIRIHTGEKPYVCTVEGCGKRFTEYSSLYKHHIVHTQSKPYVCNHCHKTYRQTSTLAMHKRTVHNDHDANLDSSSLISTITGVQIVNSVPAGTQDRESGDTEDTLVINTSESSLALPQGSSALLQHLQPAGISVQGSGIQQVYLIADPNQLETLKQIASQQQSVGEVQVKKLDDNSGQASPANTGAVSRCVVTGGGQLLEGSNNVLNAIVSSQVDQNLVSYTSE